MNTKAQITFETPSDSFQPAHVLDPMLAGAVLQGILYFGIASLVLWMVFAFGLLKNLQKENKMIRQ